MKKVLLLFCFVLLAAMNARADLIDFSSTLDFSDGEHSYVVVSETGNNRILSYDQTVNFNPPADTVESAMLTLTYTAISKSELWYVYVGNDGQTVTTWVGTLNISNPNSWATQSFDLADVLSGVTGSKWIFEISFTENTKGDGDNFRLDKSEIAGKYNPSTAAPLPASIFLLAPGVLGLIGLKKKGKMLNA
jgi:hypothetical protein